MTRPTLLFVHGTGVRGAAFDATFDTIRRQAAEALPGMPVRPCRWGELAGVQPLDEPASVPSYEAGRSAAAQAPGLTEAAQAVRWSLLYQDPLYELRAYAALAGGDTLAGDFALPAGGGAMTADAALQALGALNPSDGAIARAGHLAVDLRAPAITLLREGSTFADALAAEPLADPARSRPMIARAFVGAWMLAADRRGLPPLDGELRDRLYEDAVAALGGATMGLKDELLGALAGVATWAGKRRRTQLTDSAYAAANDILLYQTQDGGEAIRALIARHVRDIGGPVVVLAHSLGGIASVELLAATADLPVTALVTCGSQAPFLYESNVLATLRRGTPLRSDFPRWLNVFDLNDFLSYCGAAVFPGRVTDKEVDSRQPFPQSHSAYWANAATWRAIGQFLA